MAKAQPKGSTGTPVQLRPIGGRVPITRQATAAAQAGKQTEQNGQVKSAAKKDEPKPEGSGDMVDDTQKSSATSPTPTLVRIVEALANLVQKHELAGETKRVIVDIIHYARSEIEIEAKCAEEPKGQAKVSTFRNAVRQDMEQMYAAITAQMSTVYNTAAEALRNSEKVLKEAEASKATAHEIASEVSKVTEATAKIANKTESYRDAVLVSPKQNNVSNADPRVFTDMDRKAKQILVDIYDDEGSNTMSQSLTEIVNKANEVIAAMEDTEKPKEVKVLTAMKTRRSALLLTLNSKEAAEWIKDTQNEMAFTDAFSKGSHIRERAYNLVVPRVPVTFDPKEDKHLREVEEANGLATNALRRAKWIKPLGRRRPDQTHAYAIFTLTNAASANTLIRDGLNICGTKVRPTKQKQEPIQCMKCRKWGHFATECQEDDDTCGSCGEAHRTKYCKNKGKIHCVSCNDSTHTSWDRKCPEFLRRCAITDGRNPENSMPYFPTEQDWTLAVRPERIPLSERFPAKYAVNGLPFAANKHPGLAPRNNWKRKGKSTKNETREGGASAEEQTNPNLIPLNDRREEGDLPAGNEAKSDDPERDSSENDNTDENIPPGTLEC